MSWLLLIVGAVATLAVCWPLFRWSWRATGTVASPLARRFERVLLIFLGGVCFLPLYWNLGLAPVRSGAWSCYVCGLTEHRETYLGLTLSRWELDAARPSTFARFHEWYEASVGVEHEHHWRAVGCHRVGASTIACAMYPFREWYEALPALADQERAVALARRVAVATVEEREALFSRRDPVLMHYLARATSD